MKKTGVLLIQLGTPNSPSTKDVVEYKSWISVNYVKGKFSSYYIELIFIA
jgi:protoheme ferro-lyase